MNRYRKIKKLEREKSNLEYRLKFRQLKSSELTKLWTRLEEVSKDIEIHKSYIALADKL